MIGRVFFLYMVFITGLILLSEIIIWFYDPTLL